MKTTDKFRNQPAHADNDHKADFQTSNLAARRLLRRRFGFRGLPQHVTGAAEKTPAGFGQLDMGVAAAFDELDPNMQLKLLNLMGQRRGADRQI